MSPRRLLLIPIAVCFASSSLLAATATDVLRRAEVANKQVSYRGTKVAAVYFGGNVRTAALKVVHLKPDKTRTNTILPSHSRGLL